MNIPRLKTSIRHPTSVQMGCWIWLLLCLCFFSPSPSVAADSFSWRAKENRVDADIQSWSLDTFLEKLSASTGWEIYVEPGTSNEVSVKFKDLPIDEALKRMLGKLSYALLPQTNAMPKLYVFHTTMGSATQLVQPPRSKARTAKDDLISNELIVTLKPGAGVSIEELAKSLGAKIIGRDDANHAYRLKFIDAEDADAARAELKENPDVASTDANYYMEPQPQPYVLPVASAPPFPLNPTAANDPNNLIVAVIDTAVQSLPSGMDKFLLPQVSVAGESATSEQPMHGTFMSEAVLRALSDAMQGGTSNMKILPIDVYGQSEATTTFEIGKGLNEAAQRGARLINMSLGTYGNNAYLATLVRNLSNQGVIIFASAGNQPVSDPVFPAAYPGVISVTAGKDGKLEPYANRFPGNDLMVQGKSFGQFNGNSYLVTGTSSSSANAVGWAVALMTKKNMSAQQAAGALQTAFPFPQQAK